MAKLGNKEKHKNRKDEHGLKNGFENDKNYQRVKRYDQANLEDFGTMIYGYIKIKIL